MDDRGAHCDPRDVALKSLFLGPQAENGEWLQEEVRRILAGWFDWRRSLFPGDGRAISEADQRSSEFEKRRRLLSETVRRLSARFEEEVPKFSPRYVGHMFSEIALPAALGHLVALLHNPNNVSGESSRVGVLVEDEAVSELRSLVGYAASDGPGTIGHFTSGGTIANLEALLRARARLAAWLAMGAMAVKEHGPGLGAFEAAHAGWARYDDWVTIADRPGAREPFWSEVHARNFVESDPWNAAALLRESFDLPSPVPVVLVPENAHYSWRKGVSILGLGEDSLWPVALDGRGKLDVSHLRELIERAGRQQRPICLVVSVAGSTELGVFDPVHKVQDLLDEWRRKSGVHIWHHVDAAYGGFFRSVDPRYLEPEARAALQAMSGAESITLDPHKLGYVPYACGAFLTRERRDYIVKGFQAPYVQFDLARDRGPFTVEGSRPATGAAATWMIAKAGGFAVGGVYGRILARTLEMRRNLEAKLGESGLPVQVVPGAEANILNFCAGSRGEGLSSANERTEAVYRKFSPAGEGPFYVSETRLSFTSHEKLLKDFCASWGATIDRDSVALVRLCLMNPFLDTLAMNARLSDELVRCLGDAIGGMEPRNA